MAAAPSHVYPRGARLDAGGRLQIAGCDALELAREFGTPLYVLDEDELRTRAREFTEALRRHHDGPGAVLFASKALPCTAAYRVLAEEGLSCDVASGGELHLALRGGFAPERLYLHGNAKSEAELAAALEAGVGQIVLDNADDVDKLERLVAPGRRQRVLLRVTPGVEPATHAAMATGQSDSKFGWSMAEAAQAVQRLADHPQLELVGLHAHIGSQILALEPFRRAVEAMATLGPFGVYNLGGGLGADYTSLDRAPSLEDYVQVKATAVRELLGPGRTLLIEPGRSLTARAGVTLYTVQSVKRNVLTWVAVDGGMSDNMRPMLYGSRYEADVADRFAAGPRDGEICHLAGKHCESGDVIARDVRLVDPRPGDVVVTPATGAYGHAMANNYNGVPRAPVVLCSGGDARLVVRRETHEDLGARDVGL